jgi:uncharacterized membrane protein YfcA
VHCSSLRLGSQAAQPCVRSYRVHALNADIGWLFTIGLPALFAGTWLGWKLYSRLDETTFRKVVHYVLLVSGLALVTTWR